MSAVTPARPAVPGPNAPARPSQQTGTGVAQTPFPGASTHRTTGTAEMEGPEGFRRPRPRPAPRRTPNPAVSVIVPTRNEAKNLEIVLPAIAAVRPAVHEIIVVDGNSTRRLDRRRAPRAPSVKRDHPDPQGQGQRDGVRVRRRHRRRHRDVRRRRLGRPGRDPGVRLRAGRGRRLRQGQPVRPRRRQRRHHPAAPLRQRRPERRREHAVRHRLHRPLLRLQRLLGRPAAGRSTCPPIGRPQPEEGMLWGDGFEIETVLNCRVAAAGSADHGGAVRRARSACSARPTSGPSPTAPACSVLWWPSTGAPSAGARGPATPAERRSRSDALAQRHRPELVPGSSPGPAPDPCTEE